LCQEVSLITFRYDGQEKFSKEAPSMSFDQIKIEKQQSLASRLSKSGGDASFIVSGVEDFD
jgi:hypothetical protein